MASLQPLAFFGQNAQFHQKRFYYQKNTNCLETIQKKGFFIKNKTGFDFEKKNPVRGKGFTQQKNRNWER